MFDDPDISGGVEDPGPFVPWESAIETHSMLTGRLPDGREVVFFANFRILTEKIEHAEVAGKVLFDWRLKMLGINGS